MSTRYRSSPWGTSQAVWIDGLFYDPSLGRPSFRMAYVRWGKRVVDVVLASTALLLLSPVLAVIALVVWAVDGSPVIFRQQRVGRHGRPFVIYKFRTMPQHVGDVPKVRARNFPLTRAGAVLRRFCMDELPQLVNIVRGDMSFVGPRPVIADETELLRHRLENGALDIMPGLTGLAQIRGVEGMRSGTKARYDGAYTRSYGFWLDASLVIQTVAHLRHPPPVH
jgi:O-antigen biosynthesis protein WbqP